MADFVFNIAKGAVAEKVRDGAANLIFILMTALEADTVASDYDDIAALLVPAGNVEKADGGYARITGQTGAITVDDTNDRVDVDVAVDPTWSALTGTAITDLVVAYEEAAADASRIPLTNHDFAVTPDGSDVTAELNAAGFYRAS